jgi:hypothetical protein
MVLIFVSCFPWAAENDSHSHSSPPQSENDSHSHSSPPCWRFVTKYEHSAV